MRFVMPTRCVLFIIALNFAAAFAALTGVAIAGPAAWQSNCGPSFVDSSGRKLLGDLYAANPAALAAFWLPQIERMYANIPTLSPREEQWLKDELESDRFQRAISSREYAIQQAKQNAGSLLGSLRFLEGRDPEAQAERWILFAYTLIENDSDLYLARLVIEQVIRRQALPDAWMFLAPDATGRDLRDAIRYSRTFLARHVLGCTLPTVLGGRSK